MNRVVFQISALEEDSTLVSLAEPVVADTYHSRFTRPVLAQDATVDADAELGELLYRALSANTVLRDHLTGARTSTDARFPVCAELLPQSRTEDLAWETLRFPDDDGQQFLALSAKYAFARVVAACQPSVPVYRLDPPLRVAAVLSCLGVTAEHELAALRAAATSGAGSPRMRLLVILSEGELARRLEEEVEAGDAPEIAGIQLVPPDPHVLREIVREFRPHVLHLFCHGSPDGTVRLALKRDWSVAPPGPGLALDKEQVADLTRNTDGGFWLAVLNCCASAATQEGPGLTSLARELVSKGSAHAVVGMRTPIRSELARSVTRSLYGALLEDLGARIDDQDRTTSSLDWAVVVAAARRRLRDMPDLSAAAPGKEREWTVPALYLGKHEFRLQVLRSGQREDDTRTLRLELTALRWVRSSLPAGGRSTFHRALEARIAELTAQLGLRQDEAEGSS